MNTKTLARLHGSITALITPFIGGDIDYDAFRALISWQIAQGSHGIVVAGTTGEHSEIKDREFRKLFGAAVDEVHGRAHVIAGCGDSTVEQAVRLAELAHEMGADATLHVGGREAVRSVPAGAEPKEFQIALCQHFTAIHNATHIPIVMYNNPARTKTDALPDGVNMRPHTISKISQKLSRVVGIKDCDSTPGRVADLRPHIKRDDFSLLTGEDTQTLSNLEQGGHGCISVTSNIAPALCSELQNAWQQGNTARAREIHATLVHVHAAMFQRGTKNPQSVKYAASLLRPDIENTFRGGTLKPISSDHEQVVRVALSNAGLWQRQLAYA